MLIGIDASRAFLPQRTGIEEYSYQVLKNLAGKLNGHQVVLYVKSGQSVRARNLLGADCPLPGNWQVKEIDFSRLWTQVGLSLELLFHPVDVLFVPSHTVPLAHPKNTVVTIHGLEYEKLPWAYSFWEKLYMRLSIRASCRWANKIIAVSENTKKDLMELYQVPEEKVEVIYEGISEDNFKFQISNFKSNHDDQILNDKEKIGLGNLKLKIDSKFKIKNLKFILFIGRLEERKNIIGIIRAFEILKETYHVPHKLVLAGKFGFGEENIRREIANVNCQKDIIVTGFVSEEEKWKLLESADVFLFPTFYEGFGLPVLEAQSAGVPVVAGDNSSIPEIARTDQNLSVRLVDPKSAERIADAAHQLISDEKLRKEMIERGHDNVKRFSWERCAQEVGDAIRRF